MHRDMSVSVGSGLDSVVFEVPLPDQTLMKEVRGKLSVKTAAHLDMDQMMYYSCNGYVIRITDADTVDTVNDIWDRFIPKDTAFAEDSYNIDEAAAVTIAEEEFGDINLLELFGDSRGEKKIFERQAGIDIASMRAQPILDTTFKYLPTDHFDIDVQRNVGNADKCYCLFGVSNPDGANIVTEVNPTTLAEVEWNRLKFVDRLVENTWEVVAGLVDPEASGALLPGESGMAFLERMIEEVPRAVANTFNYQAGVLHAHMRGYVRLSVPGDFNMKMLGRN